MGIKSHPPVQHSSKHPFGLRPDSGALMLTFGGRVSLPEILFKGVPRRYTRGYTSEVVTRTNPSTVCIPCVGAFALATTVANSGVDLPVLADDFSTAITLLADDPDEVYLAHRDSFDAFKAAVHRTRADMDIYSYPSAVAHMAKLTMERLDELRSDDGAEEDWVTLSDLLGSARVPPEIGKRIQESLEKLIDSGDVDPEAKWRALEIWTANDQDE